MQVENNYVWIFPNCCLSSTTLFPGSLFSALMTKEAEKRDPGNGVVSSTVFRLCVLSIVCLFEFTGCSDAFKIA